MIDRSKPLSIHEFPSLIDGVARLKELEAKATPGPWKWEDWECTNDNPGIGDFTLVAPPQTRYGWKSTDFRPDMANNLMSDEEHRISEEDRALIACLRNAAPKLLDALDFQPGDASALKEIADILEEAGFVAKAAYVRRYRDMAAAMEANNGWMQKK